MAGMLVNGPAYTAERWEPAGKKPSPDPESADSITNDSGNDEDGVNKAEGPADPRTREEEQLRRLEPRIRELEKMDRLVREHEQIHKAVAGQYAGEITYRYVTGPDGKRYAVGGSTPISAPRCRQPEDTIRVMRKVRQAAMAPGDPSPEDLRVARMATMMEMEARAEIRRESAESREEISERYLEETGLKETPAMEIKKNAEGQIEIRHRRPRETNGREEGEGEEERAAAIDLPGRGLNELEGAKADSVGEAYRRAARLYSQQALMSREVDKTKQAVKEEIAK